MGNFSVVSIEKEKRLIEIKNKLDSINNSDSRFVIEEIVGVIVAIIGSIIIINHFPYEIARGFLYSLPMIFIGVGLPGVLACIRTAKYNKLSREYDNIKMEVENHKIIEQIKEKLNTMTLEKKKKYLEIIEIIDLYNKKNDDEIKSNIKSIIDADIKKQEGLMQNNEKPLTQTIAPIDRTYEEDLGNDHTKKLIK